MRVAGGISATVVLIATAACVAGCGTGTEPAAAPRNDLTLEEARAFDEFPLLYAGEQVDGLPLVAILRRDDTARYVSFVYGDCNSASSDSGCVPPAEIQVWPADARSLASYDPAVPGAPTPERTTIRGSPAAFLDDGSWFEIYTERATVVVFSHPRERVLAIAQALRCLARSPPVPGDRMLDC